MPLGHSRDEDGGHDTDQPKRFRGPGRLRGGGPGDGRRGPARGRGGFRGDRHPLRRTARGDPHAGEPQLRPAPARPYQPNAYLDRLEFGASGKILAWFTLASQGTPATRAAHFSIHPNAYRDTTPWQYTVSPGATATDSFGIGTGYGDGKYDFTVVGPNRFLRRVTGDATKAGKAAEAGSRYAVEPGTGKLALYLRMANTGASAVTFTVTANRYRGDGPWTYRVDANSSAEDFFNAVAYSDGWYDVTVTVDSDATWSRRFTGHLETGTPSVSG
ncbi:phospholipase domain-containing protein [Streptomyces sp. Ru71]|uniref:phospholipase domain-containing protein n=1 Tax=Streptomyces sp. Ru71 TaxID=2080746 RepID=UPI0026B08991|nr:phospholipase domain-containing protein [Streptomyces sp. Ru71]